MTSLGNSIAFNKEVIAEVNALIVTKEITEITFVLSDDNRIIMDALNDQNFADVRGLGNFHGEITRQKRRLKLLWQKNNLISPILSYYLNMKIKDVEAKLGHCFVDHLEINAMIYSRQRNIFSEIHSDLFYRESCSLN